MKKFMWLIKIAIVLAFIYFSLQIKVGDYAIGDHFLNWVTKSKPYTAIKKTSSEKTSPSLKENRLKSPKENPQPDITKEDKEKLEKILGK